MIIRQYCTLFDKNYLTRGLALYNSLLKVGASFHLWILAMDDETFSVLKKLDLKRVTLISLNEFEDQELLSIKATRSSVEYCWTITPSLPLYILSKNNFPEITYIDADLFFYANPEPIFEEMGNSSILLIEHRYTTSLQKLETYSGRFNVQFMTFRRDKNGMKALKWWRDRCLEWCFHEYEDGKLGDQLYLNDWPTRFQGVHILTHLGSGVAPWNVQQYKVNFQEESVYINSTQLIFYHFHSLKLYSIQNYEPASGYWIPTLVRHFIYNPYIRALNDALQKVRTIKPSWNFGFTKNPGLFQKTALKYVGLKNYLNDRIMEKKYD